MCRQSGFIEALLAQPQAVAVGVAAAGRPLIEGVKGRIDLVAAADERIALRQPYLHRLIGAEQRAFQKLPQRIEAGMAELDLQQCAEIVEGRVGQVDRVEAEVAPNQGFGVDAGTAAFEQHVFQLLLDAVDGFALADQQDRQHQQRPRAGAALPPEGGDRKVLVAAQADDLRQEADPGQAAAVDLQQQFDPGQARLQQFRDVVQRGRQQQSAVVDLVAENAGQIGRDRAGEQAGPLPRQGRRRPQPGTDGSQFELDGKGDGSGRQALLRNVHRQARRQEKRHYTASHHRRLQEPGRRLSRKTSYYRRVS